MFSIVMKGLWARKRRLSGAVVAVVLGVAFLAGALALGDTLSSNFDSLFTNANAGTDALVRSTTSVGNNVLAKRPTIPSQLAGVVARVPGVAAAAPEINGYGALVDKHGKEIGGNGPPRIASSWIADRSLNPYQLVEGRAPQADDEVVINRGAAQAGNLHIGDVTTVETPAPVRVRVVGIATFAGSDGFGTATFTAFTLHGAALHLGVPPGGVSDIRVRAVDGISQAELVARVQRVLPRGITAETGTMITQQNIDDLSGAFLTALRTLLVVFAGIALLVATFSIANTFSILVAQRTREEALLRTIGASRAQVLRSVVAETFVVGLFASCLGLVGGFGVAGLLKGLFDAAGFALPAGGLVITPTTVIVALAVGIVATVGAGLVPAIRAARVSPLQALRTSAAEPARRSRVRLIIGAAAVVGGVLEVTEAVRGSGNAVLGRVGIGALATAIGVVMLGPIVARPVTGVLARPFTRRRGVAGALARDNVMRNPRRSAAAASALLIGVAVVTLFTVFAASVKTSVTNDVDRAFVGDVAVRVGSFGGGLAPQLADELAPLPQVHTATGLATGQARVNGTVHDITAVDATKIDAVLDLHETAGAVDAVSGDRIAVSQHEADAKHWHVGTQVQLTLPDGTTTPVSVAAWYTSRTLVGDFVLPDALWSAHAQQVTDSVVLVKLAPGVGTDSGKGAVAAVAAKYGRPTVEGHDAFVNSSAQAINFVLGIVYVLLALAVVIALFGIANTLSLSIYERTREIGLLRAVGETRRQLRRTIRIESLVVSLFGTFGGIALGTFVGWGVAEAARKAQDIATFTVPATQLVVIVIVAAVAGVVAAIRPARRAARLDILRAISQE